MTTLAEKRAAIQAEHEAQQRHDPHWKQEAKEGRPISERPVVFMIDDELVAIDADVTAIRAGLDTFTALLEEPSTGLADRAKSEPAVAQAVAMAEKLRSLDVTDMLRIPQNKWNAVTLALTEAGVLVVVTDGR